MGHRARGRRGAPPRGGGGGGGGGGRVALLAPAVWPPSVRVGAGGGRSGGACGAAGFHGAAGTTLNAATGRLVVSNADPLSGRVAPAPAVCLADGAWGSCAVTRLPGALPLQGVASLRVADAAVACTDVCGASSAVVQEPQKAGSKGWFARGLLGGDGGGGEAPGGGGVVHLEVSESVALTGDAHLLHGGSASALRSLPSFLPTKKSSSLSAASSTLWIVSPSVSVADKSTIRVAGGLSVDGGPAGSGFLSVRGGGSVRVLPAPPTPRRTCSTWRPSTWTRAARWSWMARARSPSPAAARTRGRSPSGTRTRRIRSYRKPRRRRPPRSSRGDSCSTDSARCASAAGAPCARRATSLMKRKTTRSARRRGVRRTSSGRKKSLRVSSSQTQQERL